MKENANRNKRSVTYLHIFLRNVDGRNPAPWWCLESKSCRPTCKMVGRVRPIPSTLRVLLSPLFFPGSGRSFSVSERCWVEGRWKLVMSSFKLRPYAWQIFDPKVRSTKIHSFVDDVCWIAQGSWPWYHCFFPVQLNHVMMDNQHRSSIIIFLPVLHFTMHLKIPAETFAGNRKMHLNYI